MTVERSTHHGSSNTGTRETRAPDLADLTPMQRKVLEGVHSGLLNKQIAFDLGIAEKTVKAHMTALMRKLNVRNRTQVAIAAQTMRGHAHGMVQ